MTSPRGVGLGLRWSFLDEVVEGRAPEVPFFELAPENYMGRGGHLAACLAAVAADRPLLTHGLMLGLGGADPLDARYLADLRAFLADLRAPWHSDHLCWTGEGGRCLHDLLPLPTGARTASYVADRIRRAQDRLGLPVAVENITFYGAPGHAPAAGRDLALRERDLVCEVLRRAECGLLLDVNNVLCNAENHRLDPMEVLRALPLDRVVQIHVAGGERLPAFAGLVIDTHGAAVPEPVRALMAWVLERTGPLPVIYERDHRIPPLAELVAEVAEIQRVYDAAVARHDATAIGPFGQDAQDIHIASAPSSTTATGPFGQESQDIHPDLAAIQRGLADYILTADPALPGDLPAAATAALTVMGERRDVYRRLVRGGLDRLLHELLPRTLARLDDPAAWIGAWLAGPGPRSCLLRELPAEFVTWAAPRWHDDPAVPPHLGDLARHEVAELAVASAPDPTDPPGTSPAFALDARLVFDPSARLLVHAHAIRELPDDPDDRTAPPARRTALLLWRGREQSVRYLDLTPLAEALLARLLAGDTVLESLLAAARVIDEPLADPLLARATNLFTDLAERGILRGSLVPEPR